MSSFDFSNFLLNISRQPLHVLDAEIAHSSYISLDLSISNAELNTVDVADPTALQNYIDSRLNSSEGTVAYGGYLERRAIYDRSDYFYSEDRDTARNIHLGLDLWLNEGAPIYAPLDGKVHSFKNNKNFGDYGPTIILAHNIENVVFYTLYGHLSEASLEGLSPGDTVKKGEAFARLGSEKINGNYPPHLHLQIIKDMQGLKGDYPGVCNQHQLEFYKGNCPDPNLLLKID